MSEEPDPITPGPQAAGEAELPPIEVPGENGPKLAASPIAAPPARSQGDGIAETLWGMLGFAIVVAAMLVGFAIMAAVCIWAYREWMK